MSSSDERGIMPTSETNARCIRDFASRVTRKKIVGADVMATNLHRCLNTADITLLSIGHMIGSGVYVLSATVAKNMAGPAIVVAFLFSGFASFLAALCYAELGVRYPRSGSAYSYTYLALGELWAFLVGWNVALEYIIGAAATSRACSSYIDSLTGGVIKSNIMKLIGPIHVPFVSEHLDFLAFGILLIFIIWLSFGVRMTSHLNNVFSAVNMTVLVIVICVGAYFSKMKNWVNPHTGGFMPYGWSGVLAASATCFYAYVGFDSIASAGEEAKDPQKSIPRATMISMSIATVTYIGVSSVLTLMVNYKGIADDSGLPEALASQGAYWAKIVVIVGAVSGMATSIIGSLFALTRVIYVMADDGLLFMSCSKVNKRTKIPLGSMYIFSFLSAIMALILDINILVELMSIGTLVAYLVVSASVIILRYSPHRTNEIGSQELSPIGGNGTNKAPIDDATGQFRANFQVLQKCINLRPGKLVTICVAFLVIFTFLLCGFVKGYYSALKIKHWWTTFILVVLLLGILGSFVLILLHQQTTISLQYKVPLVPLVPALSVVVNAILIVNLNSATWLRLIVWVIIGMSIYFSYGIRHSKLDSTAKPPSPSPAT